MRCTLQQFSDPPVGLVARPRPGGVGGGGRGGEAQMLLFFSRSIYILEASEPGSEVPLKTGAQLTPVDVETGQPYTFLCNTSCALYDTATNCVYFFDGAALMRMDCDNSVSVVAGKQNTRSDTPRDGYGPQACFCAPPAMSSDTTGSMIVADGASGGYIRKVPLTGGQVTTVSDFGATQGKRLSLAFSTRNKQLIAATETALYGIQPDGKAKAIAGLEGHRVSRDGPGMTASFRRISGLAVPPGSDWAYLVDQGALRRVDLRTGDTVTLTTLRAEGIPGYTQLALLPQIGGLAVVAGSLNCVLLVQDSQLINSDIAPSTSPAASSYTALLPPLLQQPDSGGAVVSIRTGERVFLAHRAVLSRCSEYFRGLLEGGFKESDSAEVELPDADPDCFGHLLGYMYTGMLGDVPKERLRPMLELAGRLMMVDVSAQLTQQLLAACTPANLLANLVWAERHGSQDIVARLKARSRWDLKCAIAATPPEVLCQLMRDNPELMAEVMHKCA